MSTDGPIVDEVRRRRHEISERFGHNLRKYGEHLIEAQKEHADRLVDQVTVVKSEGREDRRSASQPSRGNPPL